MFSLFYWQKIYEQHSKKIKTSKGVKVTDKKKILFDNGGYVKVSD